MPPENTLYDAAPPVKRTRCLKPWPDSFWAKVNKNGPVPANRPDLGPCWVWTAFVAVNGYGHGTSKPGPRAEHKTDWTHRTAWRLTNGEIPEGLDLDHLCRNRACVNPDHLEPVSRRVNLLRGETLSAMNARKTHCVNGHPLSPENVYLYHGKKGVTRRCLTCARAQNRKTVERRKRERRESRESREKAQASRRRMKEGGNG